ncbi:hypothetical protein Hamer_G007029, partial [Homarus americanus]
MVKVMEEGPVDVGELLEVSGNVMREHLDPLLEVCVEALDDALGAVYNSLEEAIEAVDDLVQNIVEEVTGAYDTMEEDVTEVVEGVMETLINTLGPPLLRLQAAFNALSYNDDQVLVRTARWDELRARGSELLHHARNITTISFVMPHATALRLRVTPLLTDSCHHLLVLLIHARIPTAVTIHMEDLSTHPREVLTFFSGTDVVTIDSDLKSSPKTLTPCSRVHPKHSPRVPEFTQNTHPVFQSSPKTLTPCSRGSTSNTHPVCQSSPKTLTPCARVHPKHSPRVPEFTQNTHPVCQSSPALNCNWICVKVSAAGVLTLLVHPQMTYNWKHIRRPLLEVGELQLRLWQGRASITSDVGLSLECEHQQGLCRLAVSGDHFAATAGLLGVFDFDNYTDFMTSGWDVAARPMLLLLVVLVVLVVVVVVLVVLVVVVVVVVVLL